MEHVTFVYLKEEARAAAAELAVRDDSDAITQDVSFVHEVSGQDDRAT